MSTAGVAPAEALLLERNGGVATLTLNRPAARNALSANLIRSLQATMRLLDEEDEIGAIVLTGADPAFCAGLDMRELAAGTDNPAMELVMNGPVPAAPWRVSKPVIAAVNGVAVTGGLELVLHCDLVVASERAAFADTHARVGILPSWGMTPLLPRAVGTRVARQMSLTGEFLSVADAFRLGLVSEVLAHDQVLPRAQAIAATIAANHRGAMLAMLASYRRVEADLHSAGFATEVVSSQHWFASGFDPAGIGTRPAATE